MNIPVDAACLDFVLVKIFLYMILPGFMQNIQVVLCHFS
jgi:hypothetical protein